MRTKIWLLFLLMQSIAIHANDIRIITPYVGTINNNLAVTEIGEKLRDNSFLSGLFVQWVNPTRYQWNIFLYYSSDLNQSNLFGSHFIIDYYLTSNPKGQYALGLGVDIISITTDDATFSGLNDFEMTNTIVAPYFRAGRYFHFGNRSIRYTSLVWCGFEKDILRGDVSFKIPPPSPMAPEISISEEIDHDYEYALIGVMLKMTIVHFIELKLKYHGKISLETDDYLNHVSAMLNLYLTKHVGFSYRYKYMEESIVTNRFHLGGIALIF